MNRLNGSRICNIDLRNLIDGLISGADAVADFCWSYFAVSDEPKMYDEAMKSADRVKWMVAMVEHF